LSFRRQTITRAVSSLTLAKIGIVKPFELVAGIDRRITHFSSIIKDNRANPPIRNMQIEKLHGFSIKMGFIPVVFGRVGAGGLGGAAVRVGSRLVSIVTIRHTIVTCTFAAPLA
jgi:hypothetical protein